MPLHAGLLQGGRIQKENKMKKKRYYETCAFPKPKDSKKKKPENGWKDMSNRVCAICGEYGAERHEIFGGANRKNSMEDGLQMDLCQYHHRMWHGGTSPEVIKWRRDARRKMQQKFEEKMMECGMNEKQARACFRERYGFNLLENIPMGPG